MLLLLEEPAKTRGSFAAAILRRLAVLVIMCVAAFGITTQTCLASKPELSSEAVKKAFRQDNLDYLEGMRTFTWLLDKNPKDMMLRCKRAWCLCQIGERVYLELAVKDCDGMLQSDANCQAALYLRALALSGERKYTEAISDLNKAIGLVPNDLNSYLLLSSCYSHQKKYKECIGDLTKGIKNTPEPFILYDSRAVAYEQSGDQDHALADIEHILKYNKRTVSNEALALFRDFILHGKSKGTHITFTDVRFFVQHDNLTLKESIKKYTADITKDPHDALAYAKRAYCYLQRNDSRECLADANSILKIDRGYGIAFLFRGLANHKLRHDKDAVADLNRSIELNSTDIHCYCMRGDLYRRLHDHENSIKDLDFTLKVAPYSVGAYYLRACEYFRVADYANTRADIKTGLSIDPDDFNLLGLRQISRAADSNGQNPMMFSDLQRVTLIDSLSNSDAISTYTKEIDRNPSSLLALGKRAVSYQSVPEKRAACQSSVDDANRMLAIQPNCQAAFYLRGFGSFLIGNFPAAIKDLEQSIRLRPFDPDSYAVIGTCHAALNENAVAIADFTNAIKYGPHSVLCYSLRANEYQKRNDTKAALIDIEQGLEIDPVNIRLLEQRANIDIQRHNLNKAIADISQALKLPKASKELLGERAALYVRAGQDESAVKDCNSLIAAKLTLDKAYQYRAEALTHLKQYKEALADFDKLKTLNKNWTDSIESAQCYCGIGQYTKSLDIYSKIVESDPANVAAHLGRAKVYDELGESALANRERKVAAQYTHQSPGR